MQPAVAAPEPRIAPNPSLLRYYRSLESRIGYWLLLGGTRHFGYYTSDTKWPFPITGALRAMEDHLFNSLQLSSGTEVLDAGCGVGHVAIHLAQKGLRIRGIDFVDEHVKQARHNVATCRLEDSVKVSRGDYHDLSAFPSSSFDGAYTMETLVHATDPAQALAEFYRILKPGGHLALYEYDHKDLNTVDPALKVEMETVNKYAAMPANAAFEPGVLQDLVEDAGFEGVILDDLSRHIRPMLWLFFLLAYIPYLIISFFGLKPLFVNTVAGVGSYRGRHIWRYVVVTARKPEAAHEKGDQFRERKHR